MPSVSVRPLQGAVSARRGALVVTLGRDAGRTSKRVSLARSVLYVGRYVVAVRKLKARWIRVVVFIDLVLCPPRPLCGAVDSSMGKRFIAAPKHLDLRAAIARRKR